MSTNIFGRITGSTYQIDVNPDPEIEELVDVNRLNISDASLLVPGYKIKFNSDVGGLNPNTVYYIKTVSSTSFQISETLGGPIKQLSSETKNVTFLSYIDPEPNVLYDLINTQIVIDYTAYYERIATALESSQTAIEDMRDVVTGSREVTGGGIPIKDAYAALSYSTIFKVLTEQGVDVDSLISQTQTKLRGLE